MNELELILNSKTKLEPLARNTTVKQIEAPKKLNKTKNVKIDRKKRKKGRGEFEDFIFEEPPSDDQEQHVEMNSKQTRDFKKDDEFWEYYEKNG